jgi:hypothetical protein
MGRSALFGKIDEFLMLVEERSTQRMVDAIVTAAVFV